MGFLIVFADASRYLAGHGLWIMTKFALPVLERSVPAEKRDASSAKEIARSKPYASCEWVEGGLAFNRRSLHACLIVHHGRGYPHLADFNGVQIDVPRLLAARARIIPRIRPRATRLAEGARI